MRTDSSRWRTYDRFWRPSLLTAAGVVLAAVADTVAGAVAATVTVAAEAGRLAGATLAWERAVVADSSTSTSIAQRPLAAALLRDFFVGGAGPELSVAPTMKSRGVSAPPPATALLAGPDSLSGAARDEGKGRGEREGKEEGDPAALDAGLQRQ